MHSNDLGGKMRVCLSLLITLVWHKKSISYAKIAFILLIAPGIRADPGSGTTDSYTQFLQQQWQQQRLQRLLQQTQGGLGGGFGGLGAQIQPRRSHRGSEPKLDLEKETVQQMQQSVQKTLEQNQKLAEQVISKSGENPFGKDDKPPLDLSQIAGTVDSKPADPKPLLDAYATAGKQIAQDAIDYARTVRAIQEGTNRPIPVSPKVSERLQSLPAVDRTANVDGVLADAKSPAEPVSERTHSGSRATR